MKSSHDLAPGAGSLPYVWMLCGALAFAAMGACAHALRDAFDWQTIALARAAIPLVLAGGLAVGAGVPLVFPGPRLLWVRSVAGSVSMVSTFFAFTRLPVSDVLTLTNMYPIWVAVLSWPLLSIAPAAAEWFGALTAIAGVWLIQEPHFLSGDFASLAAFGSSFFSAVAMIGLNRLGEIDARAIVVHFSMVSLAFAAASFVAFDRGTTAGALPAAGFPWLLLAGVGVFATAGQFCLTKAFTSGPAGKVAVVGLTQIGFGALFDVALWHRTFTWQTIAGIVLVVAPTAWLLWRKGGQPRTRPVVDSP